MDRRRGIPMRPSSEDLECWTRSADTLRQLSKQFSNHPPLDLVGRTNRLIASWPTNDDLPGEGWKSLKENYKKLTASLDDIQKHADTEVRLIEQSIEQLGILMALRRAPETMGSDKRNKRPRASSPAGTPGPTGQGRGVSITLPPRDRTGSVGPSKKQGRVPLAAGRKVALWNSMVNNPGSEEDWILAIIIKVVGNEKGKFIYEVRDAEEQDTQTPVIAAQKYVIPLPDPKALSSNDFSVGSTVLALYPDTSCFYRAEVVATPKQMQATSGAKQPTYKLKFEDDDNQEHAVSAEWVVEHPIKQ
ncbi:SGF29 tudor-like domain-containing protein [Coprinopsis sp. MPI-PUGE-AT-0042]|nr:SGF29 tudor-like domain-containing protein [Coprinopsis sp. MPI-PUGE-AT-0042]